MLGPFATASHLTHIHQMSLAVLSLAACASMSTTTMTTTTTHDRGDRYGPWNGPNHPLSTAPNCSPLRNAACAECLPSAATLLHDQLAVLTLKW